MPDAKEITKFFRTHDKGIAVGPFSNVRKTTVEEWLKKERLITGRSHGGVFGVVAFYPLERNRDIADFRRKLVYTVPKGAWYCERLAFDAEDGPLMAQAMKDEAKDSEMFFQVWEESSAHKAFMKEMKAQFISSKITAYAEIIGLYSVNRRKSHGLFTNGPLFQLQPVDQLGIVKANGDALNIIRAAKEIEALPSAMFADHYSLYNESHSWSALALRGYSDDPTVIYKPTEMSVKWQAENPDKLNWTLRDTPLRKQLPGVERLIAEITRGKAQNQIDAATAWWGELTRHVDITDPDCGTEPGQTLRIHIPIVTNPGVEFGSWNVRGNKVTAHMHEGEIWYLDTRKPHTAVNKGAKPRIHLVLDVESTEQLLGMFAK